MLDIAWRPPPYSYDLAISINPGWKEVWSPFICPGGYTTHRHIPCDREIIWWHPYWDQNYSHCDEHCENDVKALLEWQWKQTKLKKLWFSLPELIVELWKIY